VGGGKEKVWKDIVHTDMLYTLCSVRLSVASSTDARAARLARLGMTPEPLLLSATAPASLPIDTTPPPPRAGDSGGVSHIVLLVI